MMIQSNPSVLEHFHTERQRRLRPTPRQGATHSPTHAGLRVRLGRALVGVGTAISGERVEPVHHKRNPQPRTA